MTVLDGDLLRRYIGGFFSYGTFGGRLWFIGAEEGGGATAEEISRRLRAWDERGGRPVDDLKGFHDHAGIILPAEPQRTWRPIMVAALAARGDTVTDAALRHYQQHELGALDGETCLLERLPLPKRSATEWPYADWSSLPELETRSRYQRTFGPPRINQILQLIQHHAPPFVVFYGNRRDWLKRLPSSRGTQEAFDAGQLGSTRWYTTDHPTSWSNDSAARFSIIGTDIARHWRGASEMV